MQSRRGSRDQLLLIDRLPHSGVSREPAQEPAEMPETLRFPFPGVWCADRGAISVTEGRKEKSGQERARERERVWVGKRLPRRTHTLSTNVQPGRRGVPGPDGLSWC